MQLTFSATSRNRDTPMQLFATITIHRFEAKSKRKNEKTYRERTADDHWTERIMPPFHFAFTFEIIPQNKLDFYFHPEYCK